jgi:hypothetical protein
VKFVIDKLALKYVYSKSFFQFSSANHLTHLSLTHGVKDRPDLAAHYHIIGIQVCGFISDPALL